MEDEFGNFYETDQQVSAFARGFGFDSDTEFNDYCDEMEKGMRDDA